MPTYAIRYFVFTVVYVVATLVWTASVSGFAGLAIFAAGVIFGGPAAAAWIAAVIIGHQVANAGVQFIVHVLSTVVIFFALSMLVLLFLGYTVSHEDNIVQAFTAIVALGAAADGAVAFWRAQTKAGSHG